MHDCVYIYWLMLFVGGVAAFYRFAEKIARDLLQGTKEEIANVTCPEDKRKELIGLVDSTLRKILEPVATGIQCVAILGFSIMLCQFLILFFEFSCSVTRGMLLVFVLELCLLTFDAARVYRELQIKAEKVHSAFVLDRVSARLQNVITKLS